MLATLATTAIVGCGTKEEKAEVAGEAVDVVESDFDYDNEITVIS